MPGKPSSSRSSSTSGVISPRSSTITGSSPSSRSAARKTAAPGPGRPVPVARGLRRRRHRPVARRSRGSGRSGRRRRGRASAAAARSTSGTPRARARPSRRAGCPTSGPRSLSGSGGAPATKSPGRKMLGMGRVVAAAGGDVDRDVADQPHVPLGGVGAERRPLALEPHLIGQRAGRRRTRPSRRSSTRSRCSNRRSSEGATDRIGIGEEPGPRREGRRRRVGRAVCRRAD